MPSVHCPPLAPHAVAGPGAASREAGLHPKAPVPLAQRNQDGGRCLAHTMRTVALTLLFVASHGQVAQVSPLWEVVVQNKQDYFAPRNGHAVCVFNDKLWLVGGRSEEYQRWDLERDVRKSDIWYTEGGSVTTGSLWRQMSAITGDFAEQQMDAKVGSRDAPFWERYGHSLDVMHYSDYPLEPIDEEIGRVADAMVMMGGFAPNPANDIWLTLDGAKCVRRAGDPITSVADSSVPLP